jgi:hypothetical protein
MSGRRDRAVAEADPLLSLSSPAAIHWTRHQNDLRPMLAKGSQAGLKIQELDESYASGLSQRVQSVASGL